MVIQILPSPPTRLVAICSPESEPRLGRFDQIEDVARKIQAGGHPVNANQMV
jgi:hypothetical protein